MTKILIHLQDDMGLLSVTDFESVSPFFRGGKGQRRAQRIMRMCAVDKLNQVYERLDAYKGTDFSARFLDDLGVNYTIGNLERFNMLPEGAFITVSNHPFGMLDGIILIDLMAGVRPDYKFMVNKVLSRVKPFNENFIAVTPVNRANHYVASASLQGVRETMKHLRQGHSIGFFPAGAVSDFSLRNLSIRDRTWQINILRLIHAAKVPVMPIRFFDVNSLFFYFLGLINWRIRVLRMPSELFNKKKKDIRIGIGNLISVEEQERFTDPEALGAFLRKAVYDMPMPASFTSRNYADSKRKP